MNGFIDGFLSLLSLTSNVGKDARLWRLAFAVVVVAGFAVTAGPVTAATPGEQWIEVDDCVVSFGSDVDVPAIRSGLIDKVVVQLNQRIAAGDCLILQDDRDLQMRRRIAELRLQAAKQDAEDDTEVQIATTMLKEAEQNHRSAGTSPASTQRLRLLEKRARQDRLRAATAVQIGEAELGTIKQQISELRVCAPTDGLVIELHKAAGEWVTAGDTIARLVTVDLLNVDALVSVRQRDPNELVDQSFNVRWEDPASGMQRHLPGRIVSVDPVRLPGGFVRVRGSIQNRLVTTDDGRQTRWELYPGTDVRLEIATRGKDVSNSQRSGRTPSRAAIERSWRADLRPDAQSFSR